MEQEFYILVRGRVATDQGRVVTARINDARAMARAFLSQPGFSGAGVTLVPVNPAPAHGLHIEAVIMEMEDDYV